jgi:hypothetical protein
MNDDADQTAELAEKLRAEILKPPDPARAAARAAEVARERRIMNSRLNSQEIERFNGLIQALERNNADLLAFGDPAVEFEALDPLDLHHRELIEQISIIDRLVRQQLGRLTSLRARAAAAERERMIANETPADRRLRLLSERLVPMESRIADLEAQVAELRRDRDQQFVRPAPPKPVMSNAPVSIGDGLCAGAGPVMLPSSGRRAR